MSIHFSRKKAGEMTGWTSRTPDTFKIVKIGKDWILTVFEAQTGAELHNFTAGRQFECCREACRYFAEGAWAAAGH